MFGCAFVFVCFVGLFFCFCRFFLFVVLVLCLAGVVLVTDPAFSWCHIWLLYISTMKLQFNKLIPKTSHFYPRHIKAKGEVFSNWETLAVHMHTSHPEASYEQLKAGLFESTNHEFVFDQTRGGPTTDGPWPGRIWNM